jgi:hypothetical protein
MTLAEDNNQIFASKYQTVLPSKEELQHGTMSRKRTHKIDKF